MRGCNLGIIDEGINSIVGARVWYEVVGKAYVDGKNTVVHREVIRDKRLAYSISRLRAVRLITSDVMTLSVRELKYKEDKGIEIKRYSNLIRDCAVSGVTDIRKIKNKAVIELMEKYPDDILMAEAMKRKVVNKRK